MIFWHNPRCGKSRAALALLTERGLTPELRLYLKDPPSPTELRAVREMLGRPAIEMVRFKEKAFAEQGLTRDSSEAELFSAMSRHPVLIERPILIHDGKARIGRPPEDLLQIV